MDSAEEEGVIVGKYFILLITNNIRK
jgi:hypothetical protein